MQVDLSTGETVEILFDAETIRARTRELADEIAAAGLRDLLVVPILKGSFIFGADLLRALNDSGLHPEVDFLFLSSYGKGTVSSGTVQVLRGVEANVAGRDVLLVDDILESGRTLAYARNMMREMGARHVATCVLLDKQVERAAEIDAEFKGFECPDVFVVGYGMDIAHRLRELPYIGRIV